MPYDPRFIDTLYDIKWLEHQYLDCGKSGLQIAQDLKTSVSVVTHNLKKFKIPLRDLSESRRQSRSKNSRHYKQLYDYEWLKATYSEKNASDIARFIGCSVPTVMYALNKFGIKRKSISEARKGRGSAYRFGSEMGRSTFYNRARMVCPPAPCAVCGSTKLSNVHHIDWDRENNAAENMERLCNFCHLKHHSIEDDLLARFYLKKTGKVLPLGIEYKLSVIDEFKIPKKKLYKRARTLLLVKLTKELRAVIQETSERLQHIEAQLPYRKGSSLCPYPGPSLKQPTKVTAPNSPSPSPNKASLSRWSPPGK